MFIQKKALFSTIVCVVVLLALPAIAAQYGQIKGVITDKETGDPVIGASIQVVGTSKGDQTDLDGRYMILMLPPGTYVIRITSVEHSTVEVTDVIVNADLTTEISMALEKKLCDMDRTITVVGKSDPLERYETASKITISQKDIKGKPVQNVNDLMRQVAGIQTTRDGDVFVRGGRAGEVSCTITEKPIGDPLAGSAPLSFVTGSVPPAHGGTAIVNGEPVDAMFFKHHGINPFVDTEDDHLSTFAIDIDDASFTLSRSFVERGHIPPEDAVRTEEFVNHFDYWYSSPDDKAFSIQLDGAPSIFGTNNVWLMRVGIKGREVNPEDRKAANLVFVVDVSGSMNREDRLGLVRKGLTMMVEQLTEDDRVGIVVYGSTGQVVLEPTSIIHKDRILAAIGALRSGGATNAEEGIRLGYEMSEKMFEKGKINRVILCSDGVANVGVTGPDAILKQIKKYADQGITLSSIGFGMGNYNDVLLEKLGNKGDGHYAYVDDLEQAHRVFVDNLTGNLQVIARDVKIQVDFDPEVVRSYRLIGYENRDVADDKFRDDKEDGGEIGSGHTVTALYELKFHSGVPRGDLGKIFVRFEDPDEDEVTEVARKISGDMFADKFDLASPGLRLAAAAAEFAEILRKSHWARGSELNDVLSLATDIYSETEAPEVLEMMVLISKTDKFQRQLAEK